MIKVYGMSKGELQEGFIEDTLNREQALEQAQLILEQARNDIDWVYIPLWQFDESRETGA